MIGYMSNPARPKQHVAVRLPPELVARLDALIPRLSTEWREATRSDVLRALLLKGLGDVEADPGSLDGRR
jgi:predicted DNA-binding protein